MVYAQAVVVFQQRDVIMSFKSLIESEYERPELNTSDDIYDFIESLYKRDTPEYEDYKHIFMSLKKKPIFFHGKLKFSTDKYNMSLFVTTGFKKYLVEMDKTWMRIFVQTKPGQKVKDFEPFNSFRFEDLM